MSELRIQQAEVLSGEEQAYWKTALRQREFGELTLPWTEAMRAAGPKTLEVLYLQVFAGSERLALAVLHLLKGLDLGGYVGGFPKKLLSRIAMTGWRPLSVDLAFIEIPGANTCGIRIAAGAEESAAKVGSAVISHIKESCRYSLLCLKTSSGSQEEARISAPGMLRTEFLPNMSIRFEGEQSFDDYMKRLHRKTRWEIRSYSNEFRSAGGEIQVHENLNDPLLETMNELYAITLRYHAENSNLQLPIPLGPSFFHELLKSLPGAFRVFVAKLHGEAVGFMLVVGSGDAVYLTHCGLDYRRSVPSRAYFNLYYAVIADAIARRATKLGLGAEAYDTKRKLGAVATPTSYYFEAKNPLLRAVSSLIAKNFSNEAQGS